MKGLKAGVDDYLAKPPWMNCSPRRSARPPRAMPTAADLLNVADLHMDVQYRRVDAEGADRAVTARVRCWVAMQEPDALRARNCERLAARLRV